MTEQISKSSSMIRLSIFISGMEDCFGSLCGRSFWGLERLLPVVGAAVTEVGEGCWGVVAEADMMNWCRGIMLMTD